MRSSRPSRFGHRLGLERLEGRSLLAVDFGPPAFGGPAPECDTPGDCEPVFVTGVPLAAATVAPVFTAGFPEGDASQPWITAAAEGADGVVVYWLKLDVRGGVTSAHLVPIWSRLNALASPVGASPDAGLVDPAAAIASIDGSIFGGSGTPLGSAPLGFADLAGFTPPLEDGVQEYFIVARSDSDFALAGLTAALLLEDMPGAEQSTTVATTVATIEAATEDGTSGAAGDASATFGTASAGQPEPAEVPPPAPVAWLQRLRAERPFAPAGDPTAAFPAAAGSPAWLVDVQKGDSGALVLWVTEASSAGAPVVRVLPVWVKFNAENTADLAAPWLGENGSDAESSTTMYSGDGTPLGELGAAVEGGRDLAVSTDDGVKTSIVVMRSESNLEILMAMVLLTVVQAPAWAAADVTVAGTEGGPWSDAAGGTGANGSMVLSAWLRGVGGAEVSAPAVSLRRDTGSSAFDRITRDGRLQVETAPGHRAEYSTDGGQTWRRSFRARPGLNAVQVRQVDRRGEASPATGFEFTLDRRRPAAPRVALAAGRDGEQAVVATAQGSLVASRVEADARIEYSVNGGAWTTAFVPAARTSRVRVRQVDVAGNVSRASVPVTLWRVVAAGDAAPAASPVFSLRTRSRRV